METGAREDVLEFYKKLPFNSITEPEVAAAMIRRCNNVEYIYPDVADFYNAESVLEIGCGAGWLSNSIAYFYGLDVMGIDFNPVVIREAEKVAEVLGNHIKFENADLFRYKTEPTDIVISIGVLHHTSDTGGGYRKMH